MEVYRMKIKITSQQYNPLLKRKEIIFEVKHEDTKGTPSRFELRKKLAEKLKTKIELLYVRKLETKTGTMLAAGEANLYDSPEQVKLVEPEHIITRNTPPEKTTEEKKE
jgi:small subunit ribosomal protein S24e